MIDFNDVWVGDLEADGLLDTATRIWCGCYLHYPSRESMFFTPDTIDNMVEWMKGKIVAFHNGAAFDIPLIQKIYGYTHSQFLDTIKMSKMMYPDIKGHKEPHSVKAWGERFHRTKPEHEDWSKWSEDMLYRCSEDTEIQWLFYQKAIKERVNAT